MSEAEKIKHLMELLTESRYYLANNVSKIPNNTDSLGRNALNQKIDEILDK